MAMAFQPPQLSIVQNQNNIVMSRLLVATFRFVTKYTTFLTRPQHKYKVVLVLDILPTFVMMMVSRLLLLSKLVVGNILTCHLANLSPSLLHVGEDVETRSLNASDMLYDSPLGKFNIYSSPYYSLHLEPVHSWLC